MTPEAVPGLKSQRFRAEREETWRKLQQLVEKVEKRGIERLSPRELAQLPLLYRSTASSLSVARSISLDRSLREYLETLTARAYFCVYGPKRGVRETIVRFFTSAFPRTLRRHWRTLALSGSFLLTGTVAGFVLTWSDPEWYYSFVSTELAGDRTPEATREQLLESIYPGDQDVLEALATFATFLFSHNSTVGILCFALGFAAGIPTFFLMMSNGLMLGAMSAIHHQRGIAVDWWGWILPHGITELFAIVVCGGAGLLLAQALIFPGRHRRVENLGKIGRDAGILVLGAVSMLLVAGLIEGFFRQLCEDVVIRYSLAITSALAWVAYLSLAGRRSA